MKFLIWFGCVFVLSLITVLLKYAGILLGFVPTFILGSLMFWTARILCKKWDINKENKKKLVADKQKTSQRVKYDLFMISSIISCVYTLFVLFDVIFFEYYDEIGGAVVLFLFYVVPLVLFFVNQYKRRIFIDVVLLWVSIFLLWFIVTLVFFTVFPDISEEIKNSCFILIISTAFQVVFSLVPFFNLVKNFYYGSIKYREKCYKKVADMQTYLEKGIITQEEFEKNKNDILKRIKTGASNYFPKTETTNIKKFDKDKTISNREESTKPVDTKELTPLVRDEAFWEKVKIIYSNLYQENGQVFFKSLAKAGLLNFNESTKSFELNVFDDGEMQRSSIYGAEFDRFLSYVFKSWMQHKIPEINAKEILKITEIISTHFNINDPYIKEIAPDSINRWNDFDKINIDEYLYGFYEGSGHKVELDEKFDEDNREILAIYDAMRWIMTDLIYTTSKTSKTFSYDEVVEYLKDNPITWKDSNDKEAALESMKMIDIYCNLSDVYLSVIQTVNWIASNEFMN